jgi:hypothetical protein
MKFARRPSMTEPTRRTFYTEGEIGSDWRVVGDSDVDLEDQLYFFLPRCPVCSDYLDDYSQTVRNRLYRLYEQLLEWEAQVIMHQIVREAFQGRLPSRGDFNGASSALKAKRQDPPGYPDPIRSARTQQYLHLVGLPSPSLGLAQPLPHFGGRSAFQRQDLPSYPDPVHSSAVGDSKKRFRGRFAVDIVCKPFDATVPTMNKGWREAAMSARMNVETAMSRGSRFWQLEHAAWSVVMQPSDPS